MRKRPSTGHEQPEPPTLRDIRQRHTACAYYNVMRPCQSSTRTAAREDPFDYGCGHGEDVELLAERGVAAGGWDPALRPHEPRTEAEIVNLGYVLNVIECPRERQQVLAEAWKLATRMLVVAARVNVEGRGYATIDTRRGPKLRISVGWAFEPVKTGTDKNFRRMGFRARQNRDGQEFP